MKILLDSDIVELLKNQKNLLAFSGGSDSSALFFILQEEDIPFDIAIVDYKLRDKSFLEAEYAKKLAKIYHKKIFIKTAPIKPPSIEEKARKIRYSFFEDIIKRYSYQNLITAHNLNDQLEWFLMQFTKGAGVVELIGMQKISKKDSYSIIRPLLDTSKKEIKEYIKDKKIKYFEDFTNIDQSFKRNFFRSQFSNHLIDLFEQGIKRSFSYLAKDKEMILEGVESLKIKNLFIIKNQKNEIKNLRAIDQIVKTLGYLLSSKQKREIFGQKDIVIGGKIAIGIKENFIFISPFVKKTMDKKFKESCRVLKIPKFIRGYIYSDNIDLNKIKNYIQKD